MNCKKIQDLLKTDFLDGELNNGQRNHIQKHIASCDHCKTFFANLRQNAVEPFKNFKEIKPPEAVWARIEKKILTNPKSTFSIFEWLKDNISPLFYFPRPAYAFTAMLLICVMTYFLYLQPSAFRRQETNEYLLDQANFIQELETENYSYGIDNFFANYL